MTHFQYGDFIEKLLVQSRDVEELVYQARNGRLISLIWRHFTIIGF